MLASIIAFIITVILVLLVVVPVLRLAALVINFFIALVQGFKGGHEA